MNRDSYIRICNKLTFLEKQMFNLRQKKLNNNEEYEEILKKYNEYSQEIIRGKEEDDGGDKFLFDDI
jgi:hypothetical protein